MNLRKYIAGILLSLFLVNLPAASQGQEPLPRPRPGGGHRGTPRESGPEASKAPQLSPTKSEPLEENEIKEIPFDTWLAAGEQPQIPWHIHLSKPILRMDQRQMIEIEVRLPGKYLSLGGEKHNFALLVRMRAAQGLWLSDSVAIHYETDKDFPKNTDLYMQTNALLRPGEYQAGIVLLDRVANQHSAALRTVQLSPLSKDPLRGLDRDLPQVEFLTGVDELDSYYRAGMKSRVWLPVETREPIRVEVLANFSPSEARAGSKTAQEHLLATLLPAVKLLAQAQFSNATLRITAVNLEQQKIIFDQDPVAPLDWPKLREALVNVNAATIDIHMLEKRKQRAAFFRDILEQRITAAQSKPPGRPAEPAAPFRIFIVLTGPTMFDSGSEHKPLEMTADCRCRFYYFQFPDVWHTPFARRGSDLIDELYPVVKPLQPRKYVIFSPMDFRKALAEMTREWKKF